MYIALLADAVPPHTPIDAIADRVVQAGFTAIELTVSPAARLTWQTSPDDARPLFETLRRAGLRVVGLTSDAFWEANYASPQPEQRDLAVQWTIRMLDLAQAMEAPVVSVVPAVVGRWGESSPQVAYADAMARTYEALCRLSFEAEQRAVTLAVENAPNRFLLSPVEFRELLDEVNSLWVQACLDIGTAQAMGFAQDWVATLSWRIASVRATDYQVSERGPNAFCLAGTGDVDWPAVIRALRQTDYDGPLIGKGPGQPAEIARALRALLDL